MTSRCIAFTNGHRCHRKAGKRSGNIFVCSRHSMWTMLLLDDGLAPETRRMLAFARWETPHEGQALIDRMYRRRAA